MTNDEIPNHEGMTKHEAPTYSGKIPRYEHPITRNPRRQGAKLTSTFGFRTSFVLGYFVIRHSSSASFVIPPFIPTLTMQGPKPRVRRMRLLRPACFALALLLMGSGAVAAKPYTEEQKPEGHFNLFLRPGKSNPTEQLAYAEELLQSGKTRKARKQFQALVYAWPNTPEAASAQFHFAAIFDQKGKLEKAFQEYQVLMDTYPGKFPYQDVLERQFDIALRIMSDRRGDVLFLPGFESPERALPLFEDIVDNGPRWEKAPEAQFLIGSIHETTKDYELAIMAYMETMLRYTHSDFAEKAAFARARCLATVSDRTPYDQDMAQEAWYALTIFNTTYPSSGFTEESSELTRHIYNRLAKGAYDIALYYDKNTRKPKAALAAYESYVTRFPSSKWTTEAKQRIQVLQQTVENDRGK